jgi:DNA-binding response OmpR family regulator
VFCDGLNGPRPPEGDAIEPDVSPTSQSAARLLWIDDQIEAGHPTVRLLRRHGFDVECARTGWDGLRKAGREPYAGIILDLRLPDVPGLAVLQRLATDEIDTPVLVVTGLPGS